MNQPSGERTLESVYPTLPSTDEWIDSQTNQAVWRTPGTIVHDGTNATQNPSKSFRSKNHSRRIPVTTMTNEQLIAQCRRGDNHAWQQLVKRYARLVHSVPVRYGLSAAEVDDVGQEVFLALAQGLQTLDDPESLPAWLLTTARRYSWRAIQKRKRENPLTDSDLAEAELPDTVGVAGAGSEHVIHHFGPRMPSMAELLEGWHRQELLATGLNRLGGRCRDLITMIFLDQNEPSYEEISAQLGIPKGSIGPTRTRCLQQLRAILEGLGFADPIADKTPN